VRLRSGGLLAVEIGAQQGPAVLAAAGREQGLTGAEIRRDLAGRDRFLLARAG
jgi:methylase of polypeptide subunit release factors